jgi:microcystin degradation protein MlrC
VLILSTYLVQVMEPFSLQALGLDVAAFDVMAIKSRVHFRRGFDDNGFARMILLVEPEQPFLGTTRLEGLPYRNVDLMRFYPYGDPVFPV